MNIAKQSGAEQSNKQLKQSNRLSCRSLGAGWSSGEKLFAERKGVGEDARGGGDERDASEGSESESESGDEE